VFYRPLTKDNMRAILDLQLAELSRLLPTGSSGLPLPRRLRNTWLRRATTRCYGARPLKRLIQSEVETAPPATSLTRPRARNGRYGRLRPRRPARQIGSLSD
jgi:ATP-dependent Clp protease ATP-binding subunit ClpA